ncbi:MAG: carboxypeptidase M32, partial [Erysipelotrichaceae bacterium]|nr:carboxypeptidase M32 [Erysipelotrichaceae bacterium]
MTTEELWKKYKEKQFIISAYELLLNTTYYDSDTIAPVKGRDYRNERMAYIGGEVFDMQTDPEYIALREELAAREDLDETSREILKWELKDLESFRYIPKDVYV